MTTKSTAKHARHYAIATPDADTKVKSHLAQSAAKSPAADATLLCNNCESVFSTPKTQRTSLPEFILYIYRHLMLIVIAHNWHVHFLYLFDCLFLTDNLIMLPLPAIAQVSQYQRPLYPLLSAATSAQPPASELFCLRLKQRCLCQDVRRLSHSHMLYRRICSSSFHATVGFQCLVNLLLYQQFLSLITIACTTANFTV